MKKIFIASYDMEIGGVERSLASMLNNFDYKEYEVDLFLHSHSGEFMKLLPKDTNLLTENKKYKTFRMGIRDVFKSKNFLIGFGRLLGKIESKKFYIKNKKAENWSEYQFIWKRTINFLPKIEKKYDVAISYLWPHNFIADKVEAKTKIAWIHTDYSIISIDRNEDLRIWNKFDYIISISDDCTKTFLKIYPNLKNKIVLVENITSQKFIRDISNEIIEELYSEKSFNLTTVARLSYQKGIDLAIEALRILKKRGYEDIKWYVVGYGGDEEEIKRLIETYSLKNNFILLGKRENPYPFMKRCDLYVQPSRYEGKAVTVTEAQILGKPVLITNYPTAGSQVNDGLDGVITDLSPEGLADGIEALYKNRETLKKLERYCEKKDFSNEKELERLYELF